MELAEKPTSVEQWNIKPTQDELFRFSAQTRSKFLAIFEQLPTGKAEPNELLPRWLDILHKERVRVFVVL